MSTILLLYYSSQSFTDISFFIACQQRLSDRTSQQVLLLYHLVVEVPGVVMLSIVPTPKVEGVNYLGGWDK